MNTRLSRFGFVGMVAAVLLATLSPPVSAVVVMDDHFDGNSGGIPAGWSLFSSPGIVTESGTTVTCTEDAGIWTDETVDPSQGDVTLSVDIAAMSGRADAGCGFIQPSVTAYVWVGLRLSDGRLQLGASDSGGNAEEHYQLGYLSGYTGGAIHLDFILGSSSFRVSTDSPPFSSGPIEYATAFSTFTREDLGAATRIVIGDDVGPGESGSCSVDRVTVEVETSTPIEMLTLGTIKALYRP